MLLVSGVGLLAEQNHGSNTPILDYKILLKVGVYYLGSNARET